MTRTRNIIDAGQPPLTSGRRASSADRAGVWFFTALFAALAVIEVTLYLTHNVYTREERARRHHAEVIRELPDQLARSSDGLAQFEARFGRFAKAWTEITGVPIESLREKPQIPPRVRDLLADPSAASAAQCWDRLREQSASYLEREGVRAQLENIGQRLRSGDARDEDGEYAAEILLRLDQWESAMDAHERCLDHIRELLQLRSLDPAATPRQGGSP